MIKKELKLNASKEKAQTLQRLFKTKKGEYGYGDVFIGVTVPVQRSIVKNHPELTIDDAIELLREKIHEYRSCGLIILVEKYKQGNRDHIVDLYFKNTKYINSWDLVDFSAPQILGDYFFLEDKSRLKKLLYSSNLWKRRIAIVSTFGFIKKGDVNTTFEYAKELLNDRHDLIHKATGWMLREAGKRDKQSLKKFLNENKMPRMTLRYAIEKFSLEERRYYLKQ
ncbi:MAG: DNA alkylation repair enzyme [Parcubacteria group bacterium ADurb.Bin247]|jgi:3-methyladenine DNA glycosylase AlkD|nr:MAG: DNA alkylation repair enzyme [Parcubacteria group bacterium ADurb.Bin247]HQB18854.1 DNA alkylation repair protein [Candidatus Pacearchaeota archaeon]